MYLLPDRAAFEACYFAGGARLVAGPGAVDVSLTTDDLGLKGTEVAYLASSSHCRAGHKARVSLAEVVAFGPPVPAPEQEAIGGAVDVAGSSDGGDGGGVQTGHLAIGIAGAALVLVAAAAAVLRRRRPEVHAKGAPQGRQGRV